MNIWVGFSMRLTLLILQSVCVCNDLQVDRSCPFSFLFLKSCTFSFLRCHKEYSFNCVTIFEMVMSVLYLFTYTEIDLSTTPHLDMQSCLLPSSNALLLWSTPQADQGVDSKSFVELLGKIL